MISHRHITRIITVLTVLAAILCIAAMAFSEAPAGAHGVFDAADLDTDWAAGAARIALGGDDIDVSGGAYVSDGDVYICAAGDYALSGALADGSVIIEAGSRDVVRILLDGASIHCETGAAIRVEQAGKVVLTLADGTENTLSGGEVYASDAADSGVDGVLYSRDDVTINGGGKLRIEARYRHGIVCNDVLAITGGDIAITAKEDAIHANDAVRIADATLLLEAGDDGITCKGDGGGEVAVYSGDITITSCYEGLEGGTVAISGGSVAVFPTDDGVNAASLIDISGGSVYIENSSGRDADGLDSNGDIDISGGTVVISVNTSSSALDYGSESGGRCLISGGTVLACGGSGMAEGFDSDSAQGFIMANVTGAAGDTVKLRRADGTALISASVPCAFTNAVLSAPGLELGDTVVLSVGDAVTELTVDNTSSGFGMTGGWSGRGDRFPGGGRDDKNGFQRPDFPGRRPDGGPGEPPSGGPPDMPGGGKDIFAQGRPDDWDGNFGGPPPGFGGDGDTLANLAAVLISLVVLVFGLVFVLAFKRRSKRR